MARNEAISMTELDPIIKSKIEEAVRLTIKQYGKVLLKLGSNNPESINLNE